MWLLFPVLITVHVLICLLMVLVVLMQRPRSEGLGAAFGGGMTDSLFGAQATHVLAKFTVWLGVAFFVVTLLLAIAYAKSSSTSTPIQRELLSVPAPVEAPVVPASSPVDASAPAPAAPTVPAPEAPAAP